MNLTLPQLLPHCNYEHFCDSCRDRERGRTFRAGVLERQGIEGVHVDFNCPKKKPWGNQPQPPPSYADIRQATARASVCDACGHNKGLKLTIISGRGTEHIYRVKCDLCSTCGGGLSLIRGKCKEKKW